MKRIVNHESRFEIGDHVEYVRGANPSLIGKHGVVTGWFKPDKPMVAVRFEKQLYDYGCFDENLKMVGDK